MKYYKWDKTVSFLFFNFFSETRFLFKNLTAVKILNLTYKFNRKDLSKSLQG
jgi:hypothetical protein